MLNSQWDCTWDDSCILDCSFTGFLFTCDGKIFSALSFLTPDIPQVSMYDSFSFQPVLEIERMCRMTDCLNYTYHDIYQFIFPETNLDITPSKTFLRKEALHHVYGIIFLIENMFLPKNSDMEMVNSYSKILKYVYWWYWL